MFATVSRFCFNTVRSKFPQSSVWRLLLLHLPTTEWSECGESVLEDRLHVERTSSMTAELFTTVRQQDVSTNVCLNSAKICQGFVRISTKLECDLKLCGCAGSILVPKTHSHPCPRTPSTILALSNPNVQLHQFAVHLGRNDVPVL